MLLHLTDNSEHNAAASYWQ